LPLSVQLPLGQAIAAVWHGFVDVQVVPAVQLAPQLPLLQTRPEPQVVPSGWLPASVQVLPGHAVTPVWQRLVGWQVAPAEQVVPQVPLVQVMPVPQAVPSG
jgi:hypothetical protein